MYDNLIKPAENGQFEGASTSAQWLNLKKKRSRCQGQWPNLKNKKSQLFRASDLKKKAIAAWPGSRSKKKKSPPGGA